MTFISGNQMNLAKEFLAEFIGTAIFMIFGLSGSAISILIDDSTMRLFRPALAMGFGVMSADFFAGPISGAHVNPAVTLAFCVIRKCEWRKLPFYVMAQYLGAFLASAIVYGLYYDAVLDLDSKTLLTNVTVESLFITYPSSTIRIWPAIADQILGTALMVFVILFITDESCYQTPRAIKTLSIGVTIVVFLTCLNYNCNAILNPARDLPPRVLLYLLGYRDHVFKALDGYFWWAVGIIGPHIGAIIGAVFYQLLTRMRAGYVSSTAKYEMSTIITSASSSTADICDKQQTSYKSSSNDNANI